MIFDHDLLFSILVLVILSAPVKTFSVSCMWGLYPPLIRFFQLPNRLNQSTPLPLNTSPPPYLFLSLLGDTEALFKLLKHVKVS